MNNMMAYAEVDALLDLLEDEYKERIPEKVRNFFKEEKMKDYEFNIDINKPLTEQRVRRETMALLAILNINYWCDSEEERIQWINELDKNEKEIEELMGKYNSANLFENRTRVVNEPIINDEKDESENMQLVEYKEKNIIQKIVDKIFKIFKRKGR
jgi:hypothetical protein